MAEYIDRSQLIQWIKQEPTDGMYTGEILSAIDEIEAADVAEVRHGKWEVVFDGNAKLYENMFECSVCKTTHIGHPNVGRYCPNCGAKMDERRDT